MDYSIIYEGVEYPLPKYSIKIAEDLEQVELVCQSNAKFREKCKRLYDLISSLLGKEACNTIIGKLEDADPNTLNIVYLNIVKKYNAPVNDYKSEEVHNTLGQLPLNDIVEALKTVQKSK